jgi:sulfur carrier protein
MESCADTLEALLEELSLKETPLVAEVDGTIIKPENFALTPIRSGECIELVRFVGGG